MAKALSGPYTGLDASLSVVSVVIRPYAEMCAVSKSAIRTMSSFFNITLAQNILCFKYGVITEPFKNHFISATDPTTLATQAIMEQTDPINGNCHYCHATLEWGSPCCFSCGHDYLNGFRPEIPWEEYEPLEPLDGFDEERILTGDITDQEDTAFYQNMVDQLQSFNSSHPYPPDAPYHYSPPRGSPLQTLPTQTQPDIMDLDQIPDGEPSPSYTLPLRNRTQEVRDAKPRTGRRASRPRGSVPPKQPTPKPPRHQPCTLGPQLPCTEPDCPVKHAAHPKGLYFHNGARPTTKDVVFGFADPPPCLREAMDRIRGRCQGGDDLRDVQLFIKLHGT